MTSPLTVIVTRTGQHTERPATLADCDRLIHQANVLYQRADRAGSVIAAQLYYAVRDELLEFRRELEEVNRP